MDIVNAESAYLDGRAKFEEWKINFEREWYRPYGIQALRILVNTLTEEQKTELRQADPEAYDYVMKRVGGKDAY